MSTFTDSLKIDPNSYWYLATPYSKYPGGMDEAFRSAAFWAGKCLLKGINVFSPIAHSHPISVFTPIDPKSHDIWLPADFPLLANAHGILVLMMESWEVSYGIQKEIEFAKERGKPVVYVNPEDLR